MQRVKLVQRKSQTKWTINKDKYQVTWKELTLKKIMSLYFLALIISVITLLAVVYLIFILGVKYHLYSFANWEEKQVAELQERIITEQRFDPTWVADPIEYTILNKENQIVSSNMSTQAQEKVLAFLDGKSIPRSSQYFVKVSYQDGTCVFKYQIGVRYYSDWANQHLPRVEIIFAFLFLLIVLLPPLLYVRAISRRICKDVDPLQNAVMAISEGNLNIPVPPLTIYEFKELGNLTERMRLDLKNTLETLWKNEYQIKEETSKMLHDYRSPLTVARANIEFLKEDLLQVKDREEKEKLLKSVQKVIFNLERLTEVADRLQTQMNPNEKQTNFSEPVTFKTLNEAINKLGEELSEYYGDEWKCQLLKAEVPLPVEESTLKQALTSIIINAFEHGNSPQTVQMNFSISPTQAEYLITNSGSKFSDQALNCATQKGFSEKAEGQQALKGLGLYFVKEFVQENKAQLVISNTVTGQAAVRVILPIANQGRKIGISNKMMIRNKH